MPRLLDTNELFTEPHSQHITVWPWATKWLGVSSAANRTIIKFKYCLFSFIVMQLFVLDKYFDLESEDKCCKGEYTNFVRNMRI